MKKALIFGVTGQDGYYLSKLLIKKGYFVHGVRRRNSIVENIRIDEIFFNKKQNCNLHYGDVTDSISTYNLIKKIRPVEIYNLDEQVNLSQYNCIKEHQKLYTFKTPDIKNKDCLYCERLFSRW